MAQTYLMLLWHMHQPFYNDLTEGVYTMPWVRLHALKDYYGMVAMLKEFPSVHVTFNLVPSLVAQLEDYACGRARELVHEAAFKPSAKLTPEERERLLTSAFQVNRENLLNRYPRFRELYEKRGKSRPHPVVQLFSQQDLLDLQVLSQLAWFEETWLDADAELRGLVAKGREYSEEDKSLLRRKEAELLNQVLEEYGSAEGRGQIEISTSPFYHPILPLICDSNVAAESHPGVMLPRRRFRHPEDARDQVREAVRLHQRAFRRRPRGLWPSEGSISDEVLRLAVDEGFTWTATDEGVLSRSLGRDFPRRADGTVPSGLELYRPYRFVDGTRQLFIFFRDHQLSDLIGFVYSRMDSEAAAADLHERVRAAGRSCAPEPAIVPLILDGENAWEFYPRNGRDFLKRFYARIASDPEVRAVTASEAIELSSSGTLSHVVPGSWINANFDIWIGAEEDNRAWGLLADAREFLAENLSKPGVTANQAALAQQEIWIAEGSDWCWWYGPEHSSGHDEEFDLLFRKHLSNLYRLLGSSPPDELAVPIKRLRARAQHVAPTGPIEPRVDGWVTNYFEWLGAGFYAPECHSGSMHGGAWYVDAFYYGSGQEALYFRLDLRRPFADLHTRFEVRVNVSGRVPTRLHALIEQGRLNHVNLWRNDRPFDGTEAQEVRVAFGSILEVRLPHGLVGLVPGDKIQVQLSLWVNELPVQVIPQEGWLSVEVTHDVASW